MKTLRVLYNGWGENWLLGTLADTGRGLLFEYSQQAIARKLELSPLNQPLPRIGAAPVTYAGETFFYGLPGFIADALPDGWGLLLMDRALRKAGRDPRTISVLERLAIIGHRAMGALCFEPAEDELLPTEQLQLKVLAQEVMRAQSELAGDADATLHHLMLLGGSPQGARPKVLVDYNARTDTVTSGLALSGSASPWLVKFPAQSEHKEVSAIEALYAKAARKAKLDMPRNKFFDLSAKHSAFGVERFDRVVQGANVLRVPTLSIGALLHADFRLPSLDYETVLLATHKITGDRRELTKAFERCVLNVLLHNQDDHARNFAFRLSETGLWQLSPLFDLTFSYGPGGEHCTSVAGFGKDITREHLLRVAMQGGLTKPTAVRVIEQSRSTVHALKTLAKDFPIRNATLAQLIKTTDSLSKQVA
jgi:serine/threonine-protein kinase HipA